MFFKNKDLLFVAITNFENGTTDAWVYFPYSLYLKLKSMGNGINQNGVNQIKYIGQSSSHLFGLIKTGQFYRLVDIDLINYRIEEIVFTYTQARILFCERIEGNFICPTLIDSIANNNVSLNQYPFLFQPNGELSSPNLLKTYNIQLGNSYLDDFLYSNKSVDIFVMSLYFFIPLLLFILGIKVLRKGFFK